MSNVDRHFKFYIHYSVFDINFSVVNIPFIKRAIGVKIN